MKWQRGTPFSTLRQRRPRQPRIKKEPVDPPPFDPPDTDDEPTAGGVQTVAGGVQTVAGGVQTAAGGVQTAAGGVQTAAGGVQTAADGVQTAKMEASGVDSGTDVLTSQEVLVTYELLEKSKPLGGGRVGGSSQLGAVGVGESSPGGSGNGHVLVRVLPVTAGDGEGVGEGTREGAGEGENKGGAAAVAASVKQEPMDASPTHTPAAVAAACDMGTPRQSHRLHLKRVARRQRSDSSSSS